VVEEKVGNSVNSSRSLSGSTMKIRGLIVAALVFLVLAGILYWSEHHKPGEIVAKASAGAPPAILKLDSSAITRLDIEKKDAAPIVLAKAESGTWRITGPQPFSADQTVISGILTTLASLNAERLVEDKATDLQQYGLGQPVLQLDITGKNNETRSLRIGDDTPTGGAVYAMLAADPRIFTMASYAKTNVDKNLNDLRDKRLLTVNPDKISRIELVRKNQDIEFGRNKNKIDDWQVLKPKALRADNSKVSELARKLTDAKMDLSGPETKDANLAFAHATPLASVKVTDDSGNQEVQVRKSQVGQNNYTYYAKSSVVDGIYKINPDFGEALDKSLDDFRTKNLFDFGFVEPNKIELHAGSNAHFLTRSGSDWWQDGKKMDAGSVQSLVSKLRDLAADKFPESGFANPIIEVTVSSEEGKRVEKILIAKSKDGYVAKRENEPTLYQLNSASGDDLQKAADGIKPAVTAGSS
jgi:hypothetical protein